MTQPEALRLAEQLEAIGLHGPVAAELRRLHAENDRLRTVMVAAAEEIDSHWEAHCDSEGYGPVNLMRRLEEGIAAEYGYTAGEFERLRAQRDALLEALKLSLRLLRTHVEPEAVGAERFDLTDSKKLAPVFAAIAKAEENT